MATTIASGTSRSHAAAPIPAWMSSTTRISSVAYAVDEMASDANTGRAIRFRSRWWPSSEVAIGLPIKTRLTSDALPIDTVILEIWSRATTPFIVPS